MFLNIFRNHEIHTFSCPDQIELNKASKAVNFSRKTNQELIRICSIHLEVRAWWYFWTETRANDSISVSFVYVCRYELYGRQVSKLKRSRDRNNTLRASI